MLSHGLLSRPVSLVPVDHFTLPWLNQHNGGGSQGSQVSLREIRHPHRGRVSPVESSTCSLANPVNHTSDLTVHPKNSDAQGQLAAAVDDLLNQLQSKFDNVSKEMFGKRVSLSPCLTARQKHIPLTVLNPVDDMTRRLDELEASLTANSNDSASATPTK